MRDAVETALAAYAVAGAVGWVWLAGHGLWWVKEGVWWLAARALGTRYQMREWVWA